MSRPGSRCNNAALGSTAMKNGLIEFWSKQLREIEDGINALENCGMDKYLLKKTSIELKLLAHRIGFETVNENFFASLSSEEINQAINWQRPKARTREISALWLQSSIQAKRKLLTQLNEAMQFVATGGKLESWLRTQKEIKKLKDTSV
jgi:hypothetical protein